MSTLPVALKRGRHYRLTLSYKPALTTIQQFYTVARNLKSPSPVAVIINQTANGASVTYTPTKDATVYTSTTLFDAGKGSKVILERVSEEAWPIT